MASSSKKWIVDIIKHFPKWFSITIISCCLIFVIVLTIVAVVTERTVEFFPPKIGLGPKNMAVEELKNIREALAKSGEVYHQRVAFLEMKLAEAREKAAIAQSKKSDGISESVQWGSSIRDYENEIKELDEIYLKQVSDTDAAIAKLIERLQPKSIN